MSNYVKTTNFLRKDSLPDTDNDKIIRGSEFDIEFNNLVTAVASKANIVSPAFTGVPTAPTASAGTSTTQIATTAFVAQNAILTGMIVMWSGSIATIPSGYVLCDGSNSTPDLRNRFIVGGGSTYDVDETGGSANAVVPTHKHTASTTVNTKTGLDGTLTLINRGGSSGAQSLMRARSGSVTYASQSQGNFGVGWEGEGGSNSSKATFKLNHNHSGSTTVNNTGESGTNKNLPPYYALAFIMKT
jgi:hypothetical protein